MIGGEVNPYPVLLLVNYWEILPSAMGLRLDELMKRGVTQVGSFIPWQVAESDISHTYTLTRFLQAAAERRMKVYLVLSPELGVHYPNSGLPKDVILRKENMAQHSNSERMVVNLPPNAFNLPSLFASEFNKRYYSFLGRMDGTFSDLAKNSPHLMTGVTAVLSGSYWKYYRSPVSSSQSVFGGSCGDYSSHATQAFRQRVEQFFSQREFMDPTPSAANQWKTRSLEGVNRRWFYQQSEDVFRSRSYQTLKKKSIGLKILETEIYTPEADPSVSYSNFFQMLAGGVADFPKLSNLIDEAALRISSGAQSPNAPFMNWSSMGGFRFLTEPEKQFLILKSLLLLGAQGGGIFLDESEWFSLSPHFRNRADSLARSFVEGDLLLRSRALYLAPHIWSEQGALWDELAKRAAPHIRMLSSMETVMSNRDAQLLIVDPTIILTRDTVHKLIAWCKAGRVLVMPRNQFYTEMAKNELERSLLKTKKIEVDIGLTYRLYAMGEGKMIVYDVPGLSSLKGEPLSSWQSFINAVLSISEIESLCRISDGRVTVIPFERKTEGLVVFVMNGTRRKVSTELVFPTPVQVGDFGAVLTQAASPLDGMRESSESLEAVAPPAKRFTLEVPPFGILPLTVDGLNMAEYRERQIAALNAEETQRSSLAAAASELPGLNSEEGLGDLWT